MKKSTLAFLVFCILYLILLSSCHAQVPTLQDQIFGKTNIIRIGKHGYIEKDKTLHFNGGALIGSSVYMYVHYKTDNILISLIAATISGVVVGTAKEFYDKSKGGAFSNDDIAFTVSGSYGGAITKIIQIDIQQQNKMLSAEYKAEFENLGTPTTIIP